MDESHAWVLWKSFFFIIFILSGVKCSEAAGVFTIINDCQYTIWPGIIPGNNFDGGGFELYSGESAAFTAPAGWQGRIWGRTACSFDQNGNGSCQTGGCGSSLRCSATGQTPATLAEFNLASPNFYDVSLVDGFNLPMTIKPVNGEGNCSSAGCTSDLRDDCPAALAENLDGQTVACRSACDVFDTDQYCCRGAYGSPGTCQPTYYSKIFKAACPSAYSYAYDDPTSLFTCTDADYIVTFCSTTPKRSQRVCRYYINRLICSGSHRHASTVQKLLIMLFLSFLSLWFTFL